MTTQSDLPEDPRVRFAAERTLLAWIRTGIALLGLGFVVARFGLFLREMAAASNTQSIPRPTGPSMILGVLITVLGVVVLVCSGWEYRNVLRRINHREPYQPSRWSIGLIMSVILAIVGLILAVYLFAL